MSDNFFCYLQNITKHATKQQVFNIFYLFCFRIWPVRIAMIRAAAGAQGALQRRTWGPRRALPARVDHDPCHRLSVSDDFLFIYLYVKNIFSQNVYYIRV